MSFNLILWYFLLHLFKNSIYRVSVICKLTMKWYLMRMCASWISFPEAAILLVRRRGSRPLARSNSGSPRFTDFPSLCACPESSLTNLIGSGLNLLCLHSHSKSECRCTWPGVPISSAWQKGPLGTRLFKVMERREHLIPKQNILEKTWKKTMFRSRVGNPETVWEINKCSAQEQYSILPCHQLFSLISFRGFIVLYLELIYLNINALANVDRLVS